MNNDDFISSGIVFFSLIGIVLISGFTGAVVRENSAKNDGRNEGIIFCTENPQQCKLEYDYLKLKETQK